MTIGRVLAQPHGTHAAYRRHLRRGEEPCAACRAADSEYNRRQYERRQGN